MKTCLGVLSALLMALIAGYMVAFITSGTSLQSSAPPRPTDTPLPVYAARAVCISNISECHNLFACNPDGTPNMNVQVGSWVSFDGHCYRVNEYDQITITKHHCFGNECHDYAICSQEPTNDIDEMEGLQFRGQCVEVDDY